MDITTDMSRMDIEQIHAELAASYWSPGIAREKVERAMQNSVCFAGLVDGQLVAFARVITDKSTFAYLADVFVVPEKRKLGLGKALIAHVLGHEDLQSLRLFMLRTRDAQTLYQKFGFSVIAKPERIMEINSAPVPDISH